MLTTFSGTVGGQLRQVLLYLVLNLNCKRGLKLTNNQVNSKQTKLKPFLNVSNSYELSKECCIHQYNT
jgi:hypothetical protein